MEPEQKSNGALTGLIIIIIILVLGGIYFWKSSMKEEPAPAVPGGIETSGTPDDTASLEADVNGIDLESLDSEI
ncbi:hypothetical protein A3A95_03300 [Candidatus Nomurabacteria bacterium RIFCSPLOWO2_01_FULL_39_18]|uniref:Uncharacterized protein n=1 Tax=Candidatus Nomurabacteria bacterium RIFCSPHIGHO2_01_FULL_40_24b TaxID=1801739 RepID=A0A1F6V6N6_9BACT|nr:MAG: hypothetical protein A2647_05135 [Candidatus Nomurabacteria bacterium RIFCSPHIGHO2_01_FULL_40_24b]OGI89113.1 MAG: hypothetical protein A3A95_03300 [Candidatus Nomurabacteria bacterium RIFCSPLOWO2_01_FULL_39_18]